MNDGTLNSNESDFNEDNIKKYISGHVRNINGENFEVCFPNSGLILDLIILLQELGHYANKPNDKDSVSLLSEAVALYTEMQSYDYLLNLGYKSEVEFYKNFRMSEIYKEAKKYCELFPFLLTYMTYGDLTKDNFEKMFSDKDYYKIIDSIEYKDDFFFSSVKMRYVFGILLASYMYGKVKSDFSYTENINIFNKNLTSLRFEESLKILGIECLDKSFMDELNQSMEKYVRLNPCKKI